MSISNRLRERYLYTDSGGNEVGVRPSLPVDIGKSVIALGVAAGAFKLGGFEMGAYIAGVSSLVLSGPFAVSLGDAIVSEINQDHGGANV